MFTSTLFATLLALSASAAPILKVKRAVDPALVPPFGIQAGVNDDGAGNCDGVVNDAGVVVKIPCSCPPPMDLFLSQLNANLDAGRVVNNPDIPPISFPLGNSNADQAARISATLITFQNLFGPGKGCPAASTNLLAKQKQLQAAPAPAPAPAPPVKKRAVDPALVPPFGIQAGVNDDGAGNCDGVVNDAGVVVKIPCSCPPPMDLFLSQLNANLDAGRVVNNPEIPPISFPLGNSNADQAARISATLITFQNLFGPGKGCPAASTNLLAKQKQLQATP